MKLIAAYTFFTALLLASAILLLKSKSPEELIIGEWEEVSWEYEKLDHNGTNDFSISDAHKQEIVKNLIIHQAETWRFSSNKNLTFLKEGGAKENLKWNMKGRGHILELCHENSIIEDYQITSISEDEMEVQFNCDLQVRGIVKLKFKKIPNIKYAQKI